jgi:hypothetical protein
MGLVTNTTDFVVGHFAGKDHEGRAQVVCVVKATYEWNERSVVVLAGSPDPLREADAYAGKPFESGLLHASDLGPPKPRIDVLLGGEIVFRHPTEEADVTLEVGTRLRKTVRAFGDRIWRAGLVADLVPSGPRPVTRIPIAWERSFGGADPRDPTCVERRNPVGSGMRRQADALTGHPAPNFEDPAHGLRSWKDRPAPQGFGPIAPHWLPRAELAGTFDQRWRSRRQPLLPEDFQPAFFNVASRDQQLDGFIAGEEVRLTSMTSAGRERFALPDLTVPVTFVGEKIVVEAATEVDTITIQPAARRFSLLARASFAPRPTILALRQIVIGLPTPGLRRAIQEGKRHLGRRRSPSN